MTKNFEIRRIDLWSLFKLSFIINAVLGLVIGFFYALMLLAIGSINSTVFAEEFPRMGLFGGFFSLMLIPFIAFVNGIFGSVLATIGGWVYNIIASMAGGLKVQTREIVEVAQYRASELGTGEQARVSEDSGLPREPGPGREGPGQR